MVRPKKISDAEILQIIAQFGEISQRDLQKKTGLTKGALSERLNRLRNEGKIRIRKVREGKTSLNMISLTEPIAPKPETQLLPESPVVEAHISAGPRQSEDQVPAAVVRGDEPVPPFKLRSLYPTFLFILLLIFFSWSGIFVLYPRAEEIATSFGSITAKGVYNMLTIFLFMGGPLTLFWTWVIVSLSQKYMMAWRKLLAATLLVWMVGVLLSPFAKTFDELITFQMVMFLGFAPLSASLVSLATNLFPSQYAKRIFLLLIIIAILGMVCGALLAALSTTSLPWVIPLVIVGVGPGVLGGFILEIRVPLNSPQEPASHLNNPNNSSWVRGRFSPLFLLINGVLNLALGFLTYYFAQILLSPNDITASILILFFLTIYNSHLLYCAFRMSNQNQIN